MYRIYYNRIIFKRLFYIAYRIITIKNKVYETMLFNSINFLIFFPIVVIVFFTLPQKLKYIWLLIASYFFYANINIMFVLLIFISTLVSYVGGLLMNQQKEKSNDKYVKYIMWSVIFINLGALFFHKYFYFVVNNIISIFSIFNITINEPTFSIILPVGISFYTFQIIAYVVDISRGSCKAEKNFINYALFIAFFPKLLAGPIERTNTFLPQLHEKKTFSYDNMVKGLQLMLFGYFLKMVIGDRAAILVNFVFENYEAYGGLEIVIAIIIYSIQIYADFFGYTMIATGVAQVMGFKLVQNFNHPYFAISVSDYWKRWHMSLSLWLRNYVYIPLGGSRVSNIKLYRNIILVLLVSGIWHGANWTYVVWGLMHGISMVLANMFKPFFIKFYDVFKVNTKCFSFTLMQIIITFIIVTSTRFVFVAPDITTAFEYINRMFSVWNPWIFFDGSLYNMGLDRQNFYILCVSIFVLFVISLLQEKGIKIRESLSKQNICFRWVIYYIAIIVILLYGVYGVGYDARNFIYFKF